MKKIVFVVGTVIALLITACGGNSIENGFREKSFS